MKEQQDEKSGSGKMHLRKRQEREMTVPGLMNKLDFATNSAREPRHKRSKTSKSITKEASKRRELHILPRKLRNVMSYRENSTRVKLEKGK